MLDTRGMEIRTGAIEGGVVELYQGDPFSLYTHERPGSRDGVSVSNPELAREVKLGSSILLDDGLIELRVVSLSDESILCEVVRGGELAGQRGLNVPDVSLSTQRGSEDYDDLLFAIRNEVDYIAASFVRSAADVIEMRKFLETHGARIPIIAKIENKEGVDRLAEIIAVADGSMVARGDLGVEMPVQEVPLIQKKIIRTTVMSGKPVITATQMLDSMERNTRPTRAEASDVANAIFDGTSAVMLSGETAKGRHPVAAVRTMAELARQAEGALDEYGDLQKIYPEPAGVVTEAVAHAAITLADHLNAGAIVTLTESGTTSRSISKYRPDCLNLAISRNPRVVRQLAMNWGVNAVLYAGGEGDESAIQYGIECARKLGCVEIGDIVVATAGISRETGSTNLIRVLTVGERRQTRSAIRDLVGDVGRDPRAGG